MTISSCCFSLRYLLACCSWSLCGFGFFVLGWVWFFFPILSPYIYAVLQHVWHTDFGSMLSFVLNRQYFSMCERTLLVLQMHVYNLVQPSCIHNKDSWFQSLSLIKVWHGRISGFSKVFRRVVMILQRHCQNLTWQYPRRYFFQAFIRNGISNHRMEVQMSVEHVCASHQWYMKWCLPAVLGEALICSINRVPALHSVPVYCPRLY